MSAKCCKSKIWSWARFGLIGFAWAYEFVTRSRNWLFDHNIKKTLWLGGPVIAVGNLTTGGTGKTPTVIFLAKMIGQTGKNAGIILRGYGAKDGEVADEVLLIKEQLPKSPIVANPDRIVGGTQAMEMGAEVIVADDAFQHRRLGRDLNLCLVDATNPFGGGWVLPIGRLRENLNGLKRADVVVLTRCDQASDKIIGEIENDIRRFAGGILIVKSAHRASGYLDFLGNEFACEDLAGKKVFAMAGIGRPDAFFDTLRELGAEIVGTRVFRDHHRFTGSDLSGAFDDAMKCGADILICTAKDRVKLAGLRQNDIDKKKLTSLEIKISMSESDEEKLRNKVLKVVEEFSREKMAKI